MEEGERISELMMMGSVIPERANLLYYIITIGWFTAWQKYTGCFKVDAGSDEEPVSKDDIILGPYPGPINNTNDMKTLFINDPNILHFTEDFSGNLHLKTGKKEEVHYKVVDQEVWNILHAQYGGCQIPRLSVSVPTEDQTKPEYIVEMQQRRFVITTYPRVNYMPKVLSKDMFVSKSDTIKEVVAKLAESRNIYLEVKDKHPAEIAKLCRLWKFEGNETLSDIKEALESTSHDMKNLPVEVHGRVLQPYEFVEDIKVADQEMLILEWRLSLTEKSDTPWAFDPKSNISKKKRYGKGSRLPESF